MVDKQTLVGELQFLSDKLSDRSRVIAGAVFAVWWATLVKDKVPGGLTIDELYWPAALSLVCFLFDLLQYFVGYLMNWYALKALEKSGATTFKYDRDHPAYWLRSFFFWMKQAASLSSIVLLINVLVRHI